MAEGKTEIKKDILYRVRWLYVIFVFVGFAIFSRVIYIQYGPHGAELRAKSQRITYERKSIPADRGDILSVDGRILATSIPTYDLRMDFGAAGINDDVFNEQVDSLAYCMSRFFGDRSKVSYKNMFVQARKNKKSNRYKLISPRRINYLELKQVMSFPLFRLGQNKGGLITEQVNKRLLPHGSLAGRTIGRVNESGTKLGIEGAFDEQLRGKDGNTLMQKVSGTFKVPVADGSNIEPTNGIDVVTTLDVDIQDVAESALKRQLDLGQANWGTVVLMEVATGEIRAMSNMTRKGDGEFVEDYNYAIGMSLEPGSTFKLATLIALLDDAKMSLDYEIDTEGGKAMVGRKLVVDDHKESVLSLRRIFEKSSNIGFAKAVHQSYSEQPERFVKAICDMGLDKPLGMQIPGESTPTVKHPSQNGWDGTSLVMMSYGYALRLTPMHTLALYNAVANSGRMVRPLLVKELREYGQTIRTFQSEVIKEQICSSETLAKVQECLAGVVDEGTGRGLKNDYYSAAAKTGTAQIAQGRHGYTDAVGGKHYLATLVGYFPADKPKYSCIVAIKTYYGPGSRHTYYGASLSGPVFRAIADRVYASQTAWQTPLAQKSKVMKDAERGVDIKSGRVEEIRRVANKLSVKIDGERTKENWGAVENDSVGVEVMPVVVRGGVVPSVLGMGLKEAIFLLESQGLKVSFSGRGRVVTQSVAPGVVAHRGQMVYINLEV